LRKLLWKSIMNNLREAAYRLDPVLWVLEILGITPTAWQETFLRSPRGSSILALTARQVGKTTTAAWAIAHSMVFTPGSLSVIACPAQRQSAEAVRRVREILLKVGAKLVSDNVFALELDNGSRVLALPGSDDSIKLGGPSPPFGVVDRQDGGGTAAQAAAADPRMGRVYVTRLRHLAAPLSPSAPLIHVSKFARDSRAAQNIYVEGDHLR
jgi:hypothetical protein